MLPNDRVRAIHDVLRLPDVRRIELGWGASVIGELAGQVTLVVYAFDAGGAVLVATYVASRTLLSMAVTLAITGFSGRVQPGSLLRRVTLDGRDQIGVGCSVRGDGTIALTGTATCYTMTIGLGEEHDDSGNHGRRCGEVGRGCVSGSASESVSGRGLGA